MRISLITAIHGRHRIVERMLRHHAAMAKQLADCCELQIVAVMSPEDSPVLFPVCDELGVAASVCCNRPVSRKWQNALDFARHFHSPDAVLILGSDDFASEAYLRNAISRVSSGVCGCGPDSVWFYSYPNGVMGLWRGPMHLGMFTNKLSDGVRNISIKSVDLPAGAGRILHRRLLDVIDWQLWDFDRDVALDTHSSKIIINRAKMHLDILRMDSIPGAAIVDVKNGSNIHDWGSLTYSHVVASEPAREILSQFGLTACIEPAEASA